ncbi:cold shock domain-containing protein [Myroides ceti]|uniref:Cold shock domain-containing protein n=1 Tax=Paenimyroides ceti TaxID=395087 RepID=A0ABT8CTL4_9FLAO|nr:cold shock domain-containing protein [Paenimyroides ceti]MDN3706973.1 cold shock domain-containing protein [Paenimyroides ceti]
MKKGVVKFFNESKGFGFIKDEETGNDIFVHVTGLKNKIKDNDSVAYRITEGKKGLSAVDVEIA